MVIAPAPRVVARRGSGTFQTPRAQGLSHRRSPPVRASHRDSVPDLIRKGADLEKVVLARAVDLHVHNHVLPYGNKTTVFA